MERRSEASMARSRALSIRCKVRGHHSITMEQAHEDRERDAMECEKLTQHLGKQA
jgi:hypothetical protein